MMWIRLLFAAMLLAATPAVSAEAIPQYCHKSDDGGLIPPSAEQAYQEGKFSLAATLAEKNPTPWALAFAARAHIADAITRVGGLCIDCLRRAESVAKAATNAVVPKQCGQWTHNETEETRAKAEGYVQLAIAIGFRGRLVDSIEAQSEGLAEKGRAAIDRALELDPLNVWARGSLGGWHLEIVHRGGPILASVLYGANEEEGLKNFRRALAADPGSLLLHYHYALSILALDTERFRSEALAKLQAGYKDPRTDALTQFTRKRTDVLMEKLKSGSIDEIETLVRRFQGYPD